MSDDHAFEETVIPGSGSTIVGDYELLGEVARGGMGVVYKARQRSLDRLVALKLILSGDEASADELKRFQVEAQAAARLDHPGIVPVYGFGELDGHPFLSMGFVDGPSLSRRLAERGPLAPREAAELLRQVADAVAAAHRKQVIHRDLKPGNVLIDEEGRARVTDFGLAKRQDAGQSLTATGQVLGTPAYMSPEQAAGQEVGPLSDVYSVGATLYAALTGKPPFASGSIPEVLLQVADVRPDPPSQQNRAVPAELDAICLKCLEKRPEDRFCSARELAEALRRFLEASLVTDLVRRTPNKRGYWLAAIGVLLAVAVSVGLWLGRQGVVPREPVADANNKKSSNEKPTETVPTKVVPLTDEGKLREALLTAQDALLPNETSVWEYRFASAGDSYERAFRDIGLVVDDNDPTAAMELLQRRSKEYLELVLQGLEQWELCADAAKQAPRASALRQLEDALDTLAWRKTVRLSRADADVKILLQAVREALANSPTPEQIDNLVLLIASLPLQKNPEAIGLLRSLLQTSPQSYLPNLVLASALQAIGQTKPTEAAAYASESIVPLQIAAKARPSAFLPHWQLIALHTQLNNQDAIAKEQDQLNQLRHPRAWPLLQSARAARLARQFDKAAEDARAAMRLDPDLPAGRSELIAALILSNHESEATDLLRQIGDESEDDAAAFRAYDELSRLVEVSRLDNDKSRRTFTSNRESSERAFRAFFLHRRKLPPENLPAAAIAPFDADEARDHQEAWSKYLGLPIEYTNSIGMKFRLIPPGEFLMGSTEEEIERVLTSQEALNNVPPHDRDYWKTRVRSEAPQHRVAFTHAVYLGTHEVTQRQYEAVMGNNPSYFCKTGKNPDWVALVDGLDTSTHPVDGVSWNNSLEFCRKLSETAPDAGVGDVDDLKSSFQRDKGYHLAMEAEWEFACRAGTTTPFWYGDFDSNVDPFEWFGNSNGRTHAVGELACNPFGLFDMHANVCEWVLDGWSDSAYQQRTVHLAVDPMFLIGTPTAKMLRGGYFHSVAANGRSATRWSYVDSTSASAACGFRVAVSIDSVRQHANAELLAKQLRFEQAESLVRAAVKARKAKEFSTAIRKIREAISLEPEVPKADVELAATLLVNGQAGEADVLLGTIATNAKDDPSAMRALRDVFTIVEQTLGTEEPDFTRRVVQRSWGAYGTHRLKLAGNPPPLAVAPFDAEQARDHQEAWSKYLGIPIEYTNTIGMKFRLIPPGEFLMGSSDEEIDHVLNLQEAINSHPPEAREYWKTLVRSESPRHRVVLTQAVYLGTHEVTQQQYEAVAGNNPSNYCKTGKNPVLAAVVAGIDTSRHPVEGVSWTDAVKFCRTLSTTEWPGSNTNGVKGSRSQDKAYRLPTEAEWEFACRAGTTTPFWFGDFDADVSQSEWLGQSSGGTHPVGELARNAFGLFDMLGNVHECVSDTLNLRPYLQRGSLAIDPEFAPDTHTYTLLRGGSIGWGPGNARVACRWSVTNDQRNNNIGFRVALSIDGVLRQANSESQTKRMRLERAESLLRKGVKARNTQDYDGAEKAIREAIMFQPDVPNGDVELATTLLAVGRQAEAEPVLAKIATEPSADSEAHAALVKAFQLATASTGDQEPDASRRAVQRAWTFYAKQRLKLDSEPPPLAIAPFDAEQAKQHQEAWAAYLKVPVEYTNSLGMKFRLIPPGEFTMGSTAAEVEQTLPFAHEDKVKALLKSEVPHHKVILTQPIYLGMHEVTQGAYEKVMGNNPSHFSANGEGKDAIAGVDTTRHPVEMVSWNDATEFCVKLSQHEKHKPFYSRIGETVTSLRGTGYRLPTEAEWEFCCRAGTTTQYWLGDKEEDLKQAGWCGEIISGARTHSVGTLKANPFGLHDVHGNLCEWVQDVWLPTYYRQFQEQPAVDPTGPSASGAERVIRGGSFYLPAVCSRSAFRHGWIAAPRHPHVGFRMALTVSAVKAVIAERATPIK